MLSQAAHASPFKLDPSVAPSGPLGSVMKGSHPEFISQALHWHDASFLGNARSLWTYRMGTPRQQSQAWVQVSMYHQAAPRQPKPKTYISDHWKIVIQQ